jgi:hypothetical protein
MVHPPVCRRAIAQVGVLPFQPVSAPDQADPARHGQRQEPGDNQRRPGPGADAGD